MKITRKGSSKLYRKRPMLPEEVQKTPPEEHSVDHWGDREEDINRERDWEEYKDSFPDKDEW